MFSEWDRIFKNPMTTAAAIDRLVHHAIVLEMTGKSIRVEDAQAECAAEPASPSTPNATPPAPGSPTRTLDELGGDDV